MRITLVSHLYPSKRSPFQGKFVRDHFDLLSDSQNHFPKLIVPTPFTIPGTEKYKESKSDLVAQDQTKTKVQYLSIPRRYLPSISKTSLENKPFTKIISSNPNIVHLHWLHPDGMLIPKLSKWGLKTVLTIHGSDWYLCKNKERLKPIIDEIFSTVAWVFYSGPKLRNDILNTYPLLANKSSTIYNMVDTDKYKPVVYDKKMEFMNELKWNRDKLHALTVASLRTEKGVDLLIDSIISDSRLSKIDFHIVGLIEQTDYSKSILDKISNYSLSNVFLHGPQHPTQLLKYYQAADFYVLPSRREGFNVSILESISCGTPIVCTNVGGNNEVIDLETGILVENIEMLASSINTMSKSFTNYKSSLLHKSIVNNFSNHSYLKKLNIVYNSLL